MKFVFKHVDLFQAKSFARQMVRLRRHFGDTSAFFSCSFRFVYVSISSERFGFCLIDKLFDEQGILGVMVSAVLL